MLEKRLVAVPPQLLTTDGTANGKLTVSDSSLFKVKQVIYIRNTTLQPVELEIKRIDDINTIYLGPLQQTIDKRSDLSVYTVASGSFIYANEQKRPTIPQEEVIRAVYEEEPVVATRVIPVDKMGNRIDSVTGPDGIVRIAVDTGTKKSDDIKITRDNDGDIVLVQKYFAGNLVRAQALFYDENKDLIEVKDV